MSKAKYTTGKLITSIAEFSESKAKFYKVRFGEQYKTRHRSFLISWQYRVLETFINHSCIFEAEEIKDENRNN